MPSLEGEQQAAARRQGTAASSRQQQGAAGKLREAAASKRKLLPSSGTKAIGTGEPPTKQVRCSSAVEATGQRHTVVETGGQALCSVCSRTTSWANRGRLTSDADCLGRSESKEHYIVGIPYRVLD